MPKTQLKTALAREQTGTARTDVGKLRQCSAYTRLARTANEITNQQGDAQYTVITQSGQTGLREIFFSVNVKRT